MTSYQGNLNTEQSQLLTLSPDLLTEYPPELATKPKTDLNSVEQALEFTFQTGEGLAFDAFETSLSQISREESAEFRLGLKDAFQQNSSQTWHCINSPLVKSLARLYLTNEVYPSLGTLQKRLAQLSILPEKRGPAMIEMATWIASRIKGILEQGYEHPEAQAEVLRRLSLDPDSEESMSTQQALGEQLGTNQLAGFVKSLAASLYTLVLDPEAAADWFGKVEAPNKGWFAAFRRAPEPLTRRDLPFTTLKLGGKPLDSVLQDTVTQLLETAKYSTDWESDLVRISLEFDALEKSGILKLNPLQWIELIDSFKQIAHNGDVNRHFAHAFVPHFMRQLYQWCEDPEEFLDQADIDTGLALLRCHIEISPYLLSTEKDRWRYTSGGKTIDHQFWQEVEPAARTERIFSKLFQILKRNEPKLNDNQRVILFTIRSELIGPILEHPKVSSNSIKSYYNKLFDTITE